MTVKKNAPLLVRIKLPAEGVTLMLRPNCSERPCSISIRNKNFAMMNNQGKLFDIEEKGDVGNFNAFYSPNAKELILSVLWLGNYSSSSSHNKSIHVSLEMFATGCFYWNKLENSWSSDGCRVRKYFPRCSFTLSSHLAVDASVLGHIVRGDLFVTMWLRDRVFSSLLLNSLLSALNKKST